MACLDDGPAGLAVIGIAHLFLHLFGNANIGHRTAALEDSRLLPLIDVPV
jgi:hypothetical protein